MAGRPTVLVTGATGFVGRRTAAMFAENGWNVRGLVREGGRAVLLPESVYPIVGDMNSSGWESGAVAGVDMIVHLAGRAHVMNNGSGDELGAFRRANVDPTARLAAAAARAGVRRFVYVSSVKVHGEGRDSAYRTDEALTPTDAYGLSKAEAEAALVESFPGEHVIVRPTFVYGEGGKGNFPRLVALARRSASVPLPLGGIHNRRSLLYVDNLASLLVCCAHHDAAAGQIFLAADAEAVSTTELLTRVGRALGITPRLFKVPPALMRAAAELVGRREEIARLLGSLTVDTSPLRAKLGWVPPFDLDAALRRSLATSLPREPHQ
ncbi:MAG: NAD-dependent epimerase/dehydratase family protein [Gemmatimonadaceae bacterium]